MWWEGGGRYSEMERTTYIQRKRDRHKVTVGGLETGRLRNTEISKGRIDGLRNAASLPALSLHPTHWVSPFSSFASFSLLAGLCRSSDAEGSV